MRFYLGTHLPGWLTRSSVPMFVSARRLRVSLPSRAIGSWALDSGGFTEISMYGRWRTNPYQYAREAEYWGNRLGNMRWAAIQDWMCEPFMLKKTGLTVEIHQRKTVESYLELREINPYVHWLPVLQGFLPEEYVKHFMMYRAAGVHLEDCPIVGLGSVCRRQATQQIADLARRFYDRGVKLHGFGVKIEGLRKGAKWFKSTDSLAWSRNARYSKPLDGCSHKNCANCIIYAMRWREKVLAAISEGLS